MPGMGQIHNKQFLKGIVILLFEHGINRLSHINSALMLSFNGHHNEALQLINYEYALFYPGFYTLCVLDSVIYAEPKPNKDCSSWFVVSGLLATFGVIYSRFIPMPLLTVGSSMIILMLIGTYVCSKRKG